jgi:isoleucyl-tRNA synthetase
LGNYIDPMETIEKHGADAVRWYFYSGGSLWLPSRFSDEAVKEAANRFMGTLWNTYSFYILYAEIDGFNPFGHTFDMETLNISDRWILSRLNSVIRNVDGHMANYRISEASRALIGFADELSNWYLRTNRARFWASGMEKDKINAYLTMFTVLSETVKLSAPLVPFITEEIYQNITRSVNSGAEVSVHLTKYPVCDESLIDGDLEKQMAGVLKIVELGRSARNAVNIKNRQPLARIFVCGTFLDEQYVEIIAGELNVKEVEFTTDASRFADYKFKPQLRTLGKKYGKLLPKISDFLSKITNGGEFLEALRDGGVEFEIDGEKVELTEADVLTETGRKEGFAGESDGALTVVLDINLTTELIEEGFVRELVSKIQTMRKESGFEVTDRITVYLRAGAELITVAKKRADYIKGEVLADMLVFGKSDVSKSWDINGRNALIGVEKI